MRTTRRFFVKLLTAITINSLLSLYCFASQAGNQALAIVVHPNTAVDELSGEQVSRIFRAEQQFWPDNSRITLLIRAPVSEARTMVLDKIYQMSEPEYRKYWISKMFKAEVASGPKVMYSSGMAFSLVSAIPGAIIFVPHANVPGGAKILRIDGKLPGEPGYLYEM